MVPTRVGCIVWAVPIMLSYIVPRLLHLFDSTSGIAMRQSKCLLALSHAEAATTFRRVGFIVGTQLRKVT